MKRLLLLVLLAACQSPSLPARSTSSDTPAVLAARALAAGRYADAALLYREALGEASGKMELHYGLAVASSYLDRRDDAIREFRWVLQYGSPNAAVMYTRFAPEDSPAASTTWVSAQVTPFVGCHPPVTA